MGGWRRGGKCIVIAWRRKCLCLLRGLCVCLKPDDLISVFEQQGGRGKEIRTLVTLPVPHA